MITYEDQNNKTSIVKVKLRQNQVGCEPIEFEVEFAGIVKKDMDLTINWKQSDLQNKGVFYTDSNGLGMLKRTLKTSKDTY